MLSKVAHDPGDRDLTLYSHATLEASDATDAVLGVLADAADARGVAAERRVVASPDRFNPDEGLALLDAYVSIADPAVRQAVLDIVLAIARTDPYRRARITEPRVTARRTRTVKRS